jgi:hypothetical protein
LNIFPSRATPEGTVETSRFQRKLFETFTSLHTRWSESTVVQRFRAIRLDSGCGTRILYVFCEKLDKGHSVDEMASMVLDGGDLHA